jgi:hypothetical protein
MSRIGVTWRGAAASLAALAAACETAPGPDDAQEDVSDAVETVEEEDPFILMIDAGRYGVIIERAAEGAIEGQPARTLPEPSELESATQSLHRAVHDLYELRAITCESGLVGEADCGPLQPPDWLGEPAGAVADAAEIRRRIDWLTEAMSPFVRAGCDAGQSRQTEELPYYCSVE